MGRNTPQARAPLYGVWRVDSITGWPGDAPLQITLDGPRSARVAFADGKQSRYAVQYDAKQHTIRFMSVEKGALLHWDASAGDKAELSGNWMSTPVTLSMHRIDPDTYLLTSRGFHWVQEYPFNR
jgi:hypothetical protein